MARAGLALARFHGRIRGCDRSLARAFVGANHLRLLALAGWIHARGHVRFGLVAVPRGNHQVAPRG